MSETRYHITAGSDRAWADHVRSTKITRVVDRALALGLETHMLVSETPSGPNGDDYTIWAVSVLFQRPRRPIHNQLDIVEMADALDVAWAWVPGPGVTPKTHYANRRRYTGSAAIDLSEIETELSIIAM